MVFRSGLGFCWEIRGNRVLFCQVGGGFRFWGVVVWSFSLVIYSITFTFCCFRGFWFMGSGFQGVVFLGLFGFCSVVFLFTFSLFCCFSITIENIGFGFVNVDLYLSGFILVLVRGRDVGLWFRISFVIVGVFFLIVYLFLDVFGIVNSLVVVVLQ